MSSGSSGWFGPRTGSDSCSEMEEAEILLRFIADLRSRFSPRALGVEPGALLKPSTVFHVIDEAEADVLRAVAKKKVATEDVEGAQREAAQKD